MAQPTGLQVLNSEKKAVEGALVAVEGKRISTVTNELGEARLGELSGSDTLTISHVGYETLRVSWRQLQFSDYIIQLAERTLSLDEVLLSANKWEQERRHLPNQIQPIEPAEIRSNNPQTTADMLGQSGQVFVQKSQLGGGSPMIRGFAANSVLIVVDGVRMNNAIYRGGNLQNVISLDANALESAEVVFGPGSVIYGSDALGGVMDFHTRNPEFSRGGLAVSGDLLTRYATANQEKTGNFNLNIGGRKLASFTSVTFSDFDDLRAGANRPRQFPDWGKRPEYAVRENGEDRVVRNDNVNLQRFSGYSQLNLLQKFRLKAGERSQFTWATHYSQTSEVPRYDRLIEYRNGRLRNAEWYYSPQSWLMNSLQWQHRPAGGFADKMKVTAAHQLVKEGRNNRRFGRNSLRQRVEEVGVLSLNADLQKSWNHEKHQLFYGLEAVRNQVHSTATTTNIETGETAPESTRYPDGGSDMSTLAGYASYRYLASERVTLTAGARYNRVWLNAHFSDTTFFRFPFSVAEVRAGSLNGSLGMVYRPAENWQLNLNLSSGFRAPNVDDAGKIFDSAPGSVVVPNPGLKPENSYNAETGFSALLADRVKVEATFWYSQLRNAMVRRNFRFNGQDSILYDGTLSQVQALVNTGRAEMYGISAAVKMELARNLVLKGTINFTEGNDLDANVPLRHVPPVFGLGSLHWKKGPWEAQAAVQWNARKHNADIAPEELEKTHLYTRGGTPAWYSLNLRLSRRLGQHLQLQTALENATDRHYRPYSSGISAAGRNLVVALRGYF